VGTVAELRRLGKNLNGYFGETIDIDSLLKEIVAAARNTSWEIETFSAGSGLELLALNRKAAPSQPMGRRVYISAGIHGDEPAGPLAIHELLTRDAWPRNLSLWICPCLNPAGFRMNRRENALGADLNRQYRAPQAEEIVAHVQWLERQPQFDLCLCLHEDWEAHGFYVYELSPGGAPSCAESMVAAVSAVCPIDRSEIIEGRPAHGGIIRPVADPRSRVQWPEAFYLIQQKTAVCYTLEAPSDYLIKPRVNALVAGVNSAISSLA
jgi:hypothetical protein